MVDSKKILLSLKAFPPKSYEGFDLDRLSVYTLYLLEKRKIPLYFDYVSVALFRFFPKKFSMANFGRYPDTYRINNSLRRLAGGLKGSSKSGWVIGSVEHGFSLTEVGKEIAKQVELLLENPTQKGSKRTTTARTRGRSSVDDVGEIRDSGSFKNWKNGKPISNYEFFAFLKAASYTPKPMLLEHLTKLKNSATTAKDKEVLNFLQWLENNFATLLK